MLRIIRTPLTGALLLGAAISVSAGTTPDQIARLGADLTPLGAERAGNQDGTIPAWTGGITSPPTGYQRGDHHPDPYADDEVLFTITADNLNRYVSNVTPGHQAMLKTYDTFKLNVYPTRRSASAPQRIYDATRQVAATAELTGGGNGVAGSVNGFRFRSRKAAWK